MSSHVKSFFASAGLALAAVLAATGAGRASTITTGPVETYAGGFGERVSPIANNTSYVAQSFIAPTGFLTQLSFELQSQSPGVDNVDDNTFHLLITETAGGTEALLPESIYPTNVVFESGDLNMPLSGGTQLFTVNLGVLDLLDGATYAFILDAFVSPPANGLPGKSAVGIRAHDVDPTDLTSYNGGHLFSLNLTDATAAMTRAQQFNQPLAWNDTVDHDIAFTLTFDPIPEPGSFALLATGLAILAARRKVCA